MWPFKKRDDSELERISSRIASLSENEAKELFVSTCDELADKISLVSNKATFTSEYDLDNSIIEFFSNYSEFNPKFMDLNISLENIGMSEVVKGYLRIGYNIEWSEILCGTNGEVFTVYLEDFDGVTFEKSDRSPTIWHYCTEQLLITYPEIAGKT